MIGDPSYRHASEYDLDMYARIVPPDHRVRALLEVIPWPSFEVELASYYTRDLGRPSEPPILMLKLEMLRWLHNLSDVGVIERATTDLAFRFFLQIPITGSLPHPTSLCKFRGRLGVDGFRQVFDQVVRIARSHGVVKDRLRLKDATHVLAHIAVPTALALVAQARDKLLQATEPFAPEMVEGERVNLEALRQSDEGLPPEQRLLLRVGVLRDMLVWMDDLAAPADSDQNQQWQHFLEQRRIAHNILSDQENPKKGDRTRSTVDPDARRARHGMWYDGYLIDICMDPDSEIITQINVLPGNGDEAADAIELIKREELAHGNEVAALSMDGAGFNGAVLRELEDPEGPGLEVFVPPPREKASTRFTPSDFTEDREAGVVTCPHGQTSCHSRRDQRDHGMIYYFPLTACRDCSSVSRCMGRVPQKGWGRSVRKNEYDAEYRRAREKSTTEEYVQIRREHMKVERKLGEVMNCHRGRHPPYWRQPRVLIAELMACTVTNMKRIARLVYAPETKLCST